MKSILVAVILIVGIVIVDHYQLLQPRATYPDKINHLIRHITSKTNPSKKLGPQPEYSQSRTVYQWTSEEGTLKISDQRPKGIIYQTIQLNPEAIPDQTPSFDENISQINQ